MTGEFEFNPHQIASKWPEINEVETELGGTSSFLDFQDGFMYL